MESLRDGWVRCHCEGHPIVLLGLQRKSQFVAPFVVLRSSTMNSSCSGRNSRDVPYASRLVEVDCTIELAHNI
jgi:hypothetical protein